MDCNPSRFTGSGLPLWVQESLPPILNLPKILRGDVNVHAMSAAPGPHNIALWIEFMNKGKCGYALHGGFCKPGWDKKAAVSAQSNHIVIDRAYIHGPSTPGSVGIKFGVVLRWAISGRY